MTTHRKAHVPFKVWKQFEAGRLGIDVHALEQRLSRKRHPMPKHTVRRGTRTIGVLMPAHEARPYLQPEPRCHHCHWVIKPGATDCAHCGAIDTDT